MRCEFSLLASHSGRKLIFSTNCMMSAPRSLISLLTILLASPSDRASLPHFSFLALAVLLARISLVLNYMAPTVGRPLFVPIAGEVAQRAGGSALVTLLGLLVRRIRIRAMLVLVAGLTARICAAPQVASESVPRPLLVSNINDKGDAILITARRVPNDLHPSSALFRQISNLHVASPCTVLVRQFRCLL